MIETLAGMGEGLLRLVGLGRSAARAVTWKPDEADVRREAAAAQQRLDDLERRASAGEATQARDRAATGN